MLYRITTLVEAMVERQKNFAVPPELNGSRLDKAIATVCADISRRSARRLISDGYVEIDRKPCKVCGRPVRAGMQIRIGHADTEQASLYADLAPPEVVYEDKDLVVFNKPPGVAVQPGKSAQLPNLVGWWEFHHQETLKVVHRLDVPASGLVALARHRQAAAHLSEQFRNHTPQRTYAARVLGNLQGEPGEELTIDEPLDRQGGSAVVTEQGKRAITRVKIENRAEGFDDIEVSPETGRFHQIRVHLAYSGHPIMGDRRYGVEPADRLHLHARGLTLDLPSGPTETFTCPSPWQ